MAIVYCKDCNKTLELKDGNLVYGHCPHDKKQYKELTREEFLEIIKKDPSTLIPHKKE